MTLKLGIIGLSEGNGHPYSWGAIFNGYEKKAMEACGFPVIPRYLEQQAWPASCIGNAKVVSVWTQDASISRKVAQAAKIEHIANTPEDMIGRIDALLLARDDAENHYRFAEPFLRAGLPVYIDKPIALSLADLKALYELERYPGQIFTCSALRYSAELQISAQDSIEVGDIKHVIATTPKSWGKYAAHIIEPVLKMLPDDDEPINYLSDGVESGGQKVVSLAVNWKSGIRTHFFALGDAAAPISIRVIGTRGWRDFTFTDSFSAFRAALNAFVCSVRTETVASPREFNTRVVSILEQGR